MVSVGVSELGSTEIRFYRAGCQSEWGILLHQPSCPEATARHIMDTPGWVGSLSFSTTAHRAHNTVAFLERKALDYIPSTLCHGRQIQRKLAQSTICIRICSLGITGFSQPSTSATRPRISIHT